MNYCKLTFVSPAYNYKEYIEKTLKNFQEMRKNFPYISWVIVDDFTCDGSYEFATSLVSDFEWIKLIRNDKNIGPGQSRIKGAENSDSDLVFFFDIDDQIIIDNCLDFINFSLEMKNNYMFYYCPLMLQKENERTQSEITVKEEIKKIRNPTDFIKNGHPQPSSMIVQRDWFLETYKDPGIPWGEDFYMYLLMSKNGTGIKFNLPSSIYIIRSNGRGAIISLRKRFLLSYEMYKKSIIGGKKINALCYTSYLTIRHTASYAYKKAMSLKNNA